MKQWKQKKRIVSYLYAVEEHFVKFKAHFLHITHTMSQICSFGKKNTLFVTKTARTQPLLFEK